MIIVPVIQQLIAGLTFVVFAAMLAVGCSDSDRNVTPTPIPSPTSTLAPGETRTATATPGPGGGVTTLPRRIEFSDAFEELPDLDRPIAMVEVPGQERFLVALQDGRVVSFDKEPGASQADVVFDNRDNTSRSGNEEGLLGMVLDPEFEENGYIYLYYNVRPGERRTVLSRFDTSGDGAGLRIVPQSELLMLTVPQPFSNHNGGQLAFGPDGMLYLALGDGGSGGDPQGNGQDLTRNLLGSIIRIDVRGATADRPYRIPSDNPFADGRGGAKPETWAYGLRNPWRFSFDRETGVLWAGDVGQGEREEIDIIVRGGNYGWNIMEGTECFRSSPGCGQDGLILPVADYGHEGGHCSVTGGYVYRGEAVPALRGVYLYADFCSGAMWGLLAADAIAGRGEPVQWQDDGPPVSTFAQDLEGELYMLAFDGRIYAITGAS